MQEVTSEKMKKHWRTRIKEDYGFKIALVLLGAAIYFAFLFILRITLVNGLLFTTSVTGFICTIKKNLWRVDVIRDEKEEKALKIFKILGIFEVSVLMILGIAITISGKIM